MIASSRCPDEPTRIERFAPLRPISLRTCMTISYLATSTLRKSALSFAKSASRSGTDIL